jgi:hypothetical protein
MQASSEDGLESDEVTQRNEMVRELARRRLLAKLDALAAQRPGR